MRLAYCGAQQQGLAQMFQQQRQRCGVKFGTVGDLDDVSRFVRTQALASAALDLAGENGHIRIGWVGTGSRTGGQCESAMHTGR
jgi:hypothetical protein